MPLSGEITVFLLFFEESHKQRGCHHHYDDDGHIMRICSEKKVRRSLAEQLETIFCLS